MAAQSFELSQLFSAGMWICAPSFSAHVRRCGTLIGTRPIPLDFSKAMA
jgi:hypothetical protein